MRPAKIRLAVAFAFASLGLGGCSSVAHLEYHDADHFTACCGGCDESAWLDAQHEFCAGEAKEIAGRTRIINGVLATPNHAEKADKKPEDCRVYQCDGKVRGD